MTVWGEAFYQLAISVLPNANQIERPLFFSDFSRPICFERASFSSVVQNFASSPEDFLAFRESPNHLWKTDVSVALPSNPTSSSSDVTIIQFEDSIEKFLSLFTFERR